MSPNLQAFLDMIAYSEIGPKLLAVSDNGYNVCVGSTPEHPILFTDYSTHPRLHNVAADSDAAGRYQFMGRYWDHYRTLLQLPDFGHDSQDKYCVQLIRECGALESVYIGDIDYAIPRVAHIWASLPGAGYHQHENKMLDLRVAFSNAGGILAANA